MVVFMALEILSLCNLDWSVMVKLFHALLACCSFFAKLERGIKMLLSISIM